MYFLIINNAGARERESGIINKETQYTLNLITHRNEDDSVSSSASGPLSAPLSLVVMFHAPSHPRHPLLDDLLLRK